MNLLWLNLFPRNSAGYTVLLHIHEPYTILGVIIASMYACRIFAHNYALWCCRHHPQIKCQRHNISLANSKKNPCNVCCWLGGYTLHDALG